MREWGREIGRWGEGGTRGGGTRGGGQGEGGTRRTRKTRGINAQCPMPTWTMPHDGRCNFLRLAAQRTAKPMPNAPCPITNSSFYAQGVDKS
ncbi:MAG: hypothetical protein KME31_01140 [Tolypothrix carrinoi HA7290-LM1]|nr:hypothetical protein [Tolypothrix carrinoi HA7290-LM1]